MTADDRDGRWGWTSLGQRLLASTKGFARAGRLRLGSLSNGHQEAGTGQPRLQGLGPRLPWRPPLPISASVVVVLLLLPALLLLRHPRPRAVGLEQLLTNASLLQSFPPSPDRPVPPLWRDRLGATLAATLWRQQRGPWWQLWGDHTDAPPLLAFSSATLPGGPQASLPANGLRVGDLVVVAADPLSRQLLQQRLLPQQPVSRGLNRRCLERLRREEAVFWSPTGLGTIAGPVEPLLQGLSHGCLSLSLSGNRLLWQGEASGGEALSGAPPATPPTAGSRLADLPPDRLLEITGGSLEPLLHGLLSRSLIREPLRRRYGLDGPRQELLRRSPFRLQLRPLPKGPFQASLELQLLVQPRQRDGWNRLLVQLGHSLLDQGLTPLGPKGAGSRDGDATWRRADGVVVGGWRWITAAGRAPELLLFLGPPPAAGERPIATDGGGLPSAGSLRLRSRPASLARLGLLPPQLPDLVPMADQLGMEITPVGAGGSDASLSLLQGDLQVLR